MPRQREASPKTGPAPDEMPKARYDDGVRPMPQPDSAESEPNADPETEQRGGQPRARDEPADRLPQGADF